MEVCRQVRTFRPGDSASSSRTIRYFQRFCGAYYLVHKRQWLHISYFRISRCLLVHVWHCWRSQGLNVRRFLHVVTKQRWYPCCAQASHTPRCETSQLRTRTWSWMFDDILHRLRAEYTLQTPTHVAAHSLPRWKVPNWYPEVR